MELNIPKEDWNNCGLLPPICYKPDPAIGKTPADRSDFLWVDIKTQPGDRVSDTVAIYVSLFLTGSTEALLKFVTLFKNIIWGQDMSTVPHKFGMTRNLVVGESLWVFEKNTWDRGTETNANYKLVMKYFITNFFPPNTLQRQKRYLQRWLYKPRNTKIRDFIFYIDKMVEYFRKFPPYVVGQRLHDYEILNLVEFFPKGVAKISNHLRVWFRNPGTHGYLWVLQYPRNFRWNFLYAGWIKSPKQKNKQSSEVHQSTSSWRRSKGQTRPQNLHNSMPKKLLHVCSLHGPGHDMNSCKSENPLGIR